ncbi:NAD-dependent epimerase/dehydratase family protein [Archangium lansingense]|uniref:NAD-dependent epimerase/dehydratase family protein n=1 Tax=Archangium lansingense TaxID=2995310 RepID=A0ABT4A1B1_9BACT|nr:NAD-dependent epimerase/dehydratase family protein [Archangium lansinium]MCY1075415.1 NAD-dependent epimerase/dehydratase family protein [Archangium lansinium]
MNTLVTGANGFLGSWLVRALLARGHVAACLVRPGSDVSGLVGLEYERLEGDVMDASSLARAVQGRDVVFHLAGLRRAATREDFMRINAEGTRRICEAMVATGARPRLVLASSLGASGPSTPGRPKVEEDPLQPAEWYGESKAEAERIAFSYADRLPVTVVRPPRIVGPGDQENLTLFKLVSRGLRLELGGGPRPLTLVDVEDVVDLLLLLAERDEALGQAFFVGHPQPLTLEELQGLVAEALSVQPRTVRVSPAVLTALATVADGVSQVTGRRLPLNRKFARQLLAPAWTCSSAKAERVLGFRATRDVADSLRRSAHWYKERGWL